MHDPTAPEHAGWFEDVFTILRLVQTTIGLPLPVTSATRACFYFLGIPDAEDARKSVDRAQEILSGKLGLTFAPGTDPAGYGTLEAALPSGLLVVIATRTQNMPGYVEARIAERMAAIQAAADEVYARTQPASAA